MRTCFNLKVVSVNGSWFAVHLKTDPCRPQVGRNQPTKRTSTVIMFTYTVWRHIVTSSSWRHTEASSSPSDAVYHM